MKTTTLGEVADWGSGGTPKRGVAEYFGKGTPWLSIADLNDRVVTSAKESLTPAGVANSSAKIVPPGTLFIAMYGSIGKLGIAGTEMATSQAIAFAKPRDEVVDRKFLFHYLLAQRPMLQARGRGGTQMNIGQADLKAWPIPLPPLPEQRRIAAILDHADTLRAKRRQVLTHLDALTQSIFNDVLGDPARNPLGFPLAPIRSLAEKFSDGPFGSNLKSSHYVDAGVPVVRLQNIGVGRYLDHDCAFVSEEHYATLSKHDCRPGDILIGTLGDPNLRACIQPDFLSRALNKADCIQFRTDPRVADPVWACWLLNAPGTLSLAASLAHGQTRTRIAMGQLRELKVPVPPIALQHEFAARVAAVSASRVRTIDASAIDDKLFASLQARAFRVEL